MHSRFLLAALLMVGLGVGRIPAARAADPDPADSVDPAAEVAPDSSAVPGGEVGQAPASEPTSDDLLFQRERYFYASFARRDPFASLLRGGFVEADGDLLDVGELSVVGIVWGEDDTFAVVQDKRNRVHTLRVGDRVVNGKVIEITRTGLTVQHSFFGETANVTIHIKQGDGADEKP